jgi:uncharacterized membrane protein YkoI
MKAKIATGTAALVALGLAAAGIASGAGSSGAASGAAGSPSGSRLDDGKQYLSEAKISEQEAIAAAQSRATGPLNEVDLEHADGRLVWNVDVGSHDVKVDATSGDVVSVAGDD